MNQFTMMPPPPNMNPYQAQGIAYDTYGNPVQTEVQQPYYMQQPQFQQSQYGYAPQYPYQQPMIQQQPQYPTIQAPQNFSMGLDSLIGTDVSIQMETAVSPDVKVKRKRRTKKSGDTDKDELVEINDAPVDPKIEKMNQVEETSYADTYQITTRMLNAIIGQLNENTLELKSDINQVRKSNPRGKYTYIANLYGALSSVRSMQITAIREINSSIKAVNEAEYRRYKDMRSMNANQDDSKFIMDMYNAMIQAPRGSLPNSYTLPNTFDLTTGTGMVRADAATPQMRDAGFDNYLNNLTPEQNAMIQESNPDIEEVIIYDQATGKKYFDWINNRTGESVPNMPQTDPMFLEDYSINPTTRIAKNANLRTTMRVVYLNEGKFNEY